MAIAYWIVAGLTALVFLAAGLTKLVRPKDQLSSTMGWVEDFSTRVIKLIAVAEILGAIGLVAPMLSGILPILSPIAGGLLAVLMIGATATHIRRKEAPVSVVPLILAAAASVLGFLLLAA